MGFDMNAIPASVLVLAAVFPAQAQVAPKLLDYQTIEHGYKVAGVPVGGLSDLSLDKATGRYLAISDARGEDGPVRFYEVALKVEDGKLSKPDLFQVNSLTEPGGNPFKSGDVDPEGIAVAADGKIYWSSEPKPPNLPKVFVSSRDGTGMSEIELPTAYRPGPGHGVMENLGFEGLALTEDGQTLVVMTENGLAQDGGVATLEAGSLVRILMIDTATLKPKAEFAYLTDPIPTAPISGGADNGVSAAMVMPDGRLAVVERSFAQGPGVSIRVYLVDTSMATDISGSETAQGATPATKVPWIVMTSASLGMKLSNVEGIAFGPEIDGAQTLLMVTDDNFSMNQDTMFMLFKLPNF
ncbi:esterase-like activity of phytase family protein [Paracoccus litorisediminis]|uniref:esterase-like activity of phytase family protein n=1 Tax=Paracoccus litorisediminis TaxID=2006130 RepID=UPI0037348104